MLENPEGLAAYVKVRQCQKKQQQLIMVVLGANWNSLAIAVKKLLL